MENGILRIETSYGYRIALRAAAIDAIDCISESQMRFMIEGRWVEVPIADEDGTIFQKLTRCLFRVSSR